MDLWFTGKRTPGVKFSIRVDRQLYNEQSEFQRTDMLGSEEFGRFLTLDGYMTLTGHDESIYHEMIVHIPMAIHPKMRCMLVIGDDGGGAIRKLIHYPEIERIDLVEIDEQAVTVYREHLSSTACGFDNPRVKLYFQSDLKFVRRQNEEYDLILVDSTDLFGPGEGLFTREFYDNCYKALRENGIMVNQHESPFYTVDTLAIQRAHRRVVKSFLINRMYQTHVPTYPSNHWLFGFASKEYHPLGDMDTRRWKKRGTPTRYYNTKLHRGTFVLSNYVEELLKNVEHID